MRISICHSMYCNDDNTQYCLVDCHHSCTLREVMFEFDSDPATVRTLVNIALFFQLICGAIRGDIVDIVMKKIMFASLGFHHFTYSCSDHEFTIIVNERQEYNGQ